MSDSKPTVVRQTTSIKPAEGNPASAYFRPAGKDGYDCIVQTVRTATSETHVALTLDQAEELASSLIRACEQWRMETIRSNKSRASTVRAS